MRNGTVRLAAMTGGAASIGLALGLVTARGHERAAEPAEIHYRLHIAPGGDPRSVAVDVDGADALEIDAAGDLLMRIGDRLVRHARPRAYQDVGGTRVHITTRFEFTSTGELRIALDTYDRNHPLTIAPLF